ncbi:CHAT domain-containing protein [Phenylobacterium sp.]|uniref:CHAT domain-containing protein n=1 Tax=Phenylobacterium sp. TaxID=1871053 RepID=UPI002D18C235|nr:CHAT domain-containing protein [Phenylobacterium sp.]HLZ77115.1 CHAT domain-containing protein [Phenylobacterium sp.]
MLTEDPLKIGYFLILPESSLADTSPFQGFSPGWENLGPFMSLLATLPADTTEPTAPLDPLISQRMGGGRQLSWTPLHVGSLEQIGVRDMGYFVVVFSADPDAAARIEAWKATQPIKPLHVTTATVDGAMSAEHFSFEALGEHLRSIVADHPDELDGRRLELAQRCLAAWAPRMPEPSGLKMLGHNILAPNQLTLLRANRSFEDGERFMGLKESDYDEKILEIVKAVFDVRERAGIRPFHRLTLIHPEIWLVEPALYRGAYHRWDRRNAPDRATTEVLRMLQTQSGFLSTGLSLEAFRESRAAQTVLTVRQGELYVFMNAVGLAASQTTSAVMRMRPAVNRIFPMLSSYARSVRSEKSEFQRKARRLFADIQGALAEAVGPERMAFLEEEVTGPVKIVADAPIEWLPIRGLPLLLRHQCSRINATPGNLMVGELARNEPVTIDPKALEDVLVISAFKPGDPLEGLMRLAIDAGTEGARGTLRVRFVSVQTVEAFKEALNSFTGSVLVFDGHGALDDGKGVGTLMIADQPLDVWTLRGEVRPPPIVLLSACDTHGIDAASHATAGNGFLALGSQTVLATLLPVGGRSAAMFIARFLLRLSDFIPAALAANSRVINWTEVVTGMQRMYLASELLDVLVGPLKALDSPRMSLQSRANLHINTGAVDWYERILADIAGHRNETVMATTSLAERIVARSESIRYIQLGHPENILIDDGRIWKAFVPAGLLDVGVPGLDPAYGALPIVASDPG